MDNYFRVTEVFPIGDSTSYDSSNFYYKKPKKKKKDDEFELILVSARDAYEMKNAVELPEEEIKEIEEDEILQDNKISS